MRRLVCLLALVSLSACAGGPTQVDAAPRCKHAPGPQRVHRGELLGGQADGVYLAYPVAVKGGSGGSLSNPRDQVGVGRYDPSTDSTRSVGPRDSVGDLGGGALWIGGDSLVRVDL